MAICANACAYAVYVCESVRVCACSWKRSHLLKRSHVIMQQHGMIAYLLQDSNGRKRRSGLIQNLLYVGSGEEVCVERSLHLILIAD